jgi:dolichyl-phosphate-mannose-protein mannosyltransferase
MNLKQRTAYAPLVFFGVLLASRASRPDKFVFDEVHYVPAAKALASMTSNLNWVHPPLGKLIPGYVWSLLSGLFGAGFGGDLFVMRLVTICFGLAVLWGVRGWLKTLGFSERATQASVWLTGFNFLWFVQSKTVMLDMYFLAFGVWGSLFVYRSKHSTARTQRSRFFCLGWLMLGLALASKWSALPFVAAAAALSFVRVRTKSPRLPEILSVIGGALLMMFSYIICFIPLSFLKTGAVTLNELYSYHKTMLSGFDKISAVTHPGASHWWQWPTMARPMWYAFETIDGKEISIWAAINPALCAVALPLSLLMLWIALVRRDKTARILSVLYWSHLLFWAVAPRGLQMIYYYLPSSIWLGPIVAWAHERYFPRFRDTRGWVLFGFTLLCGALFLYFLPIMDGRALAPGTYQHYMWFRNWI